MVRRVGVMLFAIALAAAPLLGAQEIVLDAPIDFSVTLRELSQLANDENEQAPDFDSYLVIEGYISAALVNIRTDDEFRGAVDLISGEWEGLDEVRTYQGRFLVEGDEYRDRIYDRPPRDPDENALIPGRRAIVIAQLLYFEDDPLSDRRIPVLETHAVRLVR